MRQDKLGWDIGSKFEIGKSKKQQRQKKSKMEVKFFFIFRLNVIHLQLIHWVFVYFFFQTNAFDTLATAPPMFVNIRLPTAVFPFGLYKNKVKC